MTDFTRFWLDTAALMSAASDSVATLCYCFPLESGLESKSAEKENEHETDAESSNAGLESD